MNSWIDDLRERIEALAAQAEKSVDLDALLALAGEWTETEHVPQTPVRCRIAVARDEAFCFLYEDSLDALRRAGAEIVFFRSLGSILRTVAPVGLVIFLTTWGS